MSDLCLKPIRVDGDDHSWRWDGDDPRVVCNGCGEVRDAHSGRVYRAGNALGEESAHGE